jgi:hypothetical protein
MAIRSPAQIEPHSIRNGARQTRMSACPMVIEVGVDVGGYLRVILNVSGCLNNNATVDTAVMIT